MHPNGMEGSPTEESRALSPTDGKDASSSHMKDSPTQTIGEPPSWSNGQGMNSLQPVTDAMKSSLQNRCDDSQYWLFNGNRFSCVISRNRLNDTVSFLFFVVVRETHMEEEIGRGEFAGILNRIAY